MADKDLISKWKTKSDIRYSPPLDYRLTFNEAVKNYANPNFSLLDIGTGTGKVIFDNCLYKLYKKVVGIDIEQEMINICKEKAKEISNLEFCIADSTRRMNFKNSSFNIITAMFAPYNPKEVSRLLKKDGYFILLWGLKGDHHEMTHLFPEIFDIWDGKLYFETIEERKKMLNTAGLDMIGNSTLQYQWIFKNQETLKGFYQKILLADIFKGKENRLNKLKKYKNGEIPITRIIGTTIARKI